MKVLHVLTSLNPRSGGVTQAVKSIVYGLEELGVRSEVVTFDGAPGYGVDEPLTVHNLGPASTSWQYAPKFVDWLDSHLPSYTHVILHGLWQYHTFAVFRALKTTLGDSPKIFVMPHGMLDPWFQHSSHRRIKALRNALYWQIVEKTTANQADALLFTSEQELQKARTTFPAYEPNSERIVGLGVLRPPLFSLDMTEAFNRLDPRFGGSPYLLYMARIDKKKGIDLLISAYLNLKADGHALPMLVVAGPGLETSFGNEVRHLAGRDPSIVFTGMLSGHAKWGALYGCSAFVLPSHQENFGIAVVEALACHKPVLITDQVDIYSEIQTSGGSLVSDDTLTGITGLLTDWGDMSEAKKHQMAVYAGQAYENYFTPEIAAQRMRGALL